MKTIILQITILILSSGLFAAAITLAHLSENKKTKINLAIGSIVFLFVAVTQACLLFYKIDSKPTTQISVGFLYGKSI